MLALVLSVLIALFMLIGTAIALVGDIVFIIYGFNAAMAFILIASGVLSYVMVWAFNKMRV
jgi:hypothetical protein